MECDQEIFGQFVFYYKWEGEERVNKPLWTIWREFYFCRENNTAMKLQVFDCWRSCRAKLVWISLCIHTSRCKQSLITTCDIRTALEAMSVIPLTSACPGQHFTPSSWVHGCNHKPEWVCCSLFMKAQLEQQARNCTTALPALVKPYCPPRKVTSEALTPGRPIVHLGYPDSSCRWQWHNQLPQRKVQKLLQQQLLNNLPTKLSSSFQ